MWAAKGVLRQIRMIFMKAKTWYDDYIGTVAADISDYLDKECLNTLIPRNVPDFERYTVVGFEFYARYEEMIFALLCRDMQAGDDGSLVAVEVNCDLSSFFNLFKRFNLNLLPRGYEESAVKTRIKMQEPV